jgi:hypothetical protein
LDDVVDFVPQPRNPGDPAADERSVHRFEAIPIRGVGTRHFEAIQKAGGSNVHGRGID